MYCSSLTPRRNWIFEARRLWVVHQKIDNRWSSDVCQNSMNGRDEAHHRGAIHNRDDDVHSMREVFRGSLTTYNIPCKSQLIPRQTCSLQIQCILKIRRHYVKGEIALTHTSIFTHYMFITFLEWEWNNKKESKHLLGTCRHWTKLPWSNVC